VKDDEYYDEEYDQEEESKSPSPQKDMSMKVVQAASPPSNMSMSFKQK